MDHEPLNSNRSAGFAGPAGSVRDWTEDTGYENGNYMNRCDICGETFVGHKRRTWCKACARQCLRFSDPMAGAANIKRSVGNLKAEMPSVSKLPSGLRELSDVNFD
jgi:hypothetical protein